MNTGDGYRFGGAGLTGACETGGQKKETALANMPDWLAHQGEVFDNKVTCVSPYRR